MEKTSKEPESCKSHSNLVLKALLLLSCSIVIAQFALFAKNFASLKALNKRLNTLEEERTLDCDSLKSKKRGHGTRRSKRSIDEKDFRKAMVKLEKLEGR